MMIFKWKVEGKMWNVGTGGALASLVFYQFKINPNDLMILFELYLKPYFRI